jgi:hypothetical protein
MYESDCGLTWQTETAEDHLSAISPVFFQREGGMLLHGLTGRLLLGCEISGPVVGRGPATAVMRMKEDSKRVCELRMNDATLQLLDFRPRSTASAEGKGVGCERARSIPGARNCIFSRFALSFVTFVDSVCARVPKRLPQPFSRSLSKLADQHELSTCIF